MSAVFVPNNKYQKVMWSPKKNLREWLNYPARYVITFTVQIGLSNSRASHWRSFCGNCRETAIGVARATHKATSSWNGYKLHLDTALRHFGGRVTF